jgi:hypothetical protein
MDNGFGGAGAECKQTYSLNNIYRDISIDQKKTASPFRIFLEGN